MANKDVPCWECSAPSEHDHHPIPRSRGGTKTIPLCVGCHGKAHDQSMGIAQLVKEGIARARANGVDWGKGKRGEHYAKVLALHRRGWSVARISHHLALHRRYVSQLISRVDKAGRK